jgi:hypothetical protein
MISRRLNQLYFSLDLSDLNEKSRTPKLKDYNVL